MQGIRILKNKEDLSGVKKRDRPERPRGPSRRADREGGKAEPSPFTGKLQKRYLSEKLREPGASAGDI